jgi:HMG (high mobility group) box
MCAWSHSPNGKSGFTYASRRPQERSYLPVLCSPLTRTLDTRTLILNNYEGGNIMVPGTVAKPKRPLSAYNFFFKIERTNILKQIPDVAADQKPRRSHGKIGFKDLATRISAKWKSLAPEERSIFEAMAVCSKERYLVEKKEWKISTKMTANPTPLRASTDSLHEFVDFQRSIDQMPSKAKTSPLAAFHLEIDGSMPSTDEHCLGHLTSQFHNETPAVSEDPPLMPCEFRMEERLSLNLDGDFQVCESMVLKQSPIQDNSLVNGSPASWSNYLDAQLSVDLDHECKTFLKAMFKQSPPVEQGPCCYEE